MQDHELRIDSEVADASAATNFNEGAMDIGGSCDSGKSGEVMETDPAESPAGSRSEAAASGPQAASANDVSEEIISSYEFRALSQTVTVTFASA